MKMMIKIYMTLFFSVLYSCQKNSAGGTTAGNPLISFAMTGSSAPTTLALNNISSPLWSSFFTQAMALPPPVLKDSTNQSINLSQAWISIKRVEFKATETPLPGEVSGDSVSFDTPTAINLIDSNLQSLGQARVMSTLRRLKMQLSNVDVLPTGAPAGLQNKSFYWKGTVGLRNFTFTSTEGYEYELSGPNNVSLFENSSILLSIQIANLFRKINMSAVTDGAQINQTTRVPATNPCPLINASAADIYTCFKDGLKTESNLGNDQANDGELTGDVTVK